MSASSNRNLSQFLNKKRKLQKEVDKTYLFRYILGYIGKHIQHYGTEPNNNNENEYDISDVQEKVFNIINGKNKNKTFQAKFESLFFWSVICECLKNYCKGNLENCNF